jgi:hypothetical protein
MCAIGVLLNTLGWEISRVRELLAGCRDFCGRGGAGFLATPAGFRRPFGRFAHELHSHEAGDELLQANTVEINRRSLGVGFRHDSVSVLLVLDALPFGKNLHNCLLICRWRL